MNARRSLCAVLMTLAGTAFAVCLHASSAEARPNPQMTCRAVGSGGVRCEAKYVWPAIPTYAVYYADGRLRDDMGAGYGEGFGMTIPLLKGEWLTIEMRVADQVFRVEARAKAGKNGKAGVRNPQFQMALK